LEALTLIFPYVNTHTKNLILSELEYFAQGYDKELIKEAVRAIGRCAQSETRNAARCLRVLLRQVESSDGTLVAESLTVIRHIIQQNPTAHSKTVIRLAKALDTATNPTARASIIWLVGEFSGMDDGNNVAADTLRILAKNFSSESDQAKQQIVLLAAKVYAHHLNRTQLTRPPPGTEEDGISDDDDEAQKHPIALLFSYILLLARYDLSYDLRDRARLYKSLLAVPSSTQLATLLLLAPKPTPQAPSPSSGREGLTLGSAAMVIGKEESIRGYEPLPDWVSADRAPSPSVREPPVTADSAPRSTMVATGISSKDQARSGGYGKHPLGASPKFSQLEERGPAVGAQSKSNEKVETSLEDFLASDDESEEEDEESEEESEEEDSEEEDSEEEDDEDDDEEDEEEDDSADEKENSQLLGGSK
jgi:AP-3 complex subunit beta